MLGVILYGYRAEFVSSDSKEENSMLFTKNDQGLLFHGSNTMR